MSSELPRILLSQLTIAVPYLLLYTICFFCALALRSRAPKAAILALVGIAILFAVSFFGTLTTAYIINMQIGGNIPAEKMNLIFNGLGIVRALGYVVGFVAVFAAVFVGRSDKAQPVSRPQPPVVNQPPPVA
ncbi:ABC-type multidrug transport system fused ATPase/permease subunit [Ereboglobus sp. PH5-5]|uniref:hypothetical protein n=1 Tax=Ereboglobus sp. PH5-5 TaxID=2940529 RepID=UPI00240695CA|nr:hypothetical protein [Ereboglobus sp. PH5-5]MDF9833229.1 ABC-type multidrug transport system fused ATPase/permease subunit [Ereboglobus sp. PH5-5]